MLARFRAQFAASSGITQTGRCATTAIHICFAADPVDDHTLRVVKAMRRALRSALTRSDANELRAAWTHAKADVLCPAPVPPNTLTKHTSEEPRWSQVSGPISAATATLSPLGWRLPNPQRWTSPEGTGYSVRDHPEVPFLRLVSKSVQTSLWKKAATHYCAAGIESSPDPVSFKLLKAFRREGAVVEAGLLECMLCAGFWFPERVAAAFPREVSPICDKCPHNVPATPAHVLWECPSLKHSVAPEVIKTQELVPEASFNHNHAACYWLRRLLPKVWVLEQVPPLPLTYLLSYVGFVPDDGWPSGEYFTDGAGGSHSSWPALRRCGCGVVFLAAGVVLAPLFGAFFPLAGEPQTVPRAELFAIIVVLLFLSPGAAAIIHTDSELCSKGFAAQTDQGENADLWQLLWSTISAKSLDIQVRWVKAHGLEHPEFISKFALSLHQLLGNALADKLADRAADAAAIDPDIACRILSLYAETQAIQRRFVSTLGILVREREADIIFA